MNWRNGPADTQEVFLAYDWPGNVRQLQNVIRNVVVLHNGEQVTVEMLPSPLNAGIPSGKDDAVAARAIDTLPASPKDSAPLKPLWLVEKEAIEHAVALCSGNIPRAAALLALSPSTIYRKRQAWASEAACMSRQPIVDGCESVGRDAAKVLFGARF